MNIFSLKNTSSIVTGGLGNLGPWWIKALIDAGSKVAIIDLSSADLNSQILDFQKDYEKNIYIYRADIVKTDELRKVHKDITKDLGLIDILVNNAGIDTPPIKNSEKDYKGQDDKYLSMWQVNVQGVVNCIEEFSSDMKKKKNGSIINIGSLYGQRSPDEKFYDHLGFDKPWAYGATKAAVDQISRHFATRLAKYNIRVNTLSPGGVFNDQDKEFVRKYCKRVPLSRMADKKNDLAGPLVFLASSASNYVTGINLEVNGGYTTW